MKRLLLALAIISIPVQAKAVVCYADAEGVRKATGMWPSWTFNMKGHKGSKCYYPVDKGGKQSHTNGNQPEPVKPSPPTTVIPSSIFTSNAAPVVQSDSNVTPQESSTLGNKKEVMPPVSTNTRQPNHTPETRPQPSHLTAEAVPLPPEAPHTIKLRHISDGIRNYVEFFEELNQIDRFEMWAKRLF